MNHNEEKIDSQITEQEHATNNGESIKEKIKNIFDNIKNKFNDLPKRIRIVLLGAVGILAVFLLWQGPISWMFSGSDGTSVIPKNAVGVVVVDIGSLMDKAKFKDVKELDVIKDLLSDDDDLVMSIIKDPKKSGIDLSDDIFMFNVWESVDESPVPCVSASIDDEENFEKFLKKALEERYEKEPYKDGEEKGYEFEVKEEDNYKYAFNKNGTQGFAWNDDVILYVGGGQGGMMLNIMGDMDIPMLDDFKYRDKKRERSEAAAPNREWDDGRSWEERKKDEEEKRKKEREERIKENQKETKKIIDKLMNLDSDETIESNKSFNKFYSDKTDVCGWISTDFLEDFVPGKMKATITTGAKAVNGALDLEDDEELSFDALLGNSVSFFFNFGKGHVSFKGGVFLNETMVNIIEKTTEGEGYSGLDTEELSMEFILTFDDSGAFGRNSLNALIMSSYNIYDKVLKEAGKNFSKMFGGMLGGIGAMDEVEDIMKDMDR